MGLTLCRVYAKMKMVPGKTKKEGKRMKRYEWRLINATLGWWGLWDNVMREYVIETTAVSKSVYEKMGF